MTAVCETMVEFEEDMLVAIAEAVEEAAADMVEFETAVEG